MQVLPGFPAVHPVALRRSSDPGRPGSASPWRNCRCGPQLHNTEGAIIVAYRGSITPLRHPLCTLHDMRCRTPCNTRSRLAGYTFTGQESNLLDCDRWFPLCHSFLHFRTLPGAMQEQFFDPGGNRLLPYIRPFNGDLCPLALMEFAPTCPYQALDLNMEHRQVSHESGL